MGKLAEKSKKKSGEEIKRTDIDGGVFVSRLLDWYAMNARSLPWRDNPLPYYVWVSEIMLQQTRVEAVRGYFARFIEILPDIRSLAQADEELLLKLWEGLGYYSRVRNMKKAAIMVMEQYDGRLPREVSELLRLPGIGAYTAGAIASIAYGRVAAAVDGNVLRVMSRIAGDASDISKNAVRERWAKKIEELIPVQYPGAFNQALMDLGAMVCLPNGAPLCGECPMRELCAAGKDGSWRSLPVKPAKKARRIEERTIYVIETKEGVLVRKRPPEGLLAGLWEFPSQEGWQSMEEAQSYVQIPCEIVELGEAKHIFSHIEWRMIGYYCRLQHKPSLCGEECVAVPWERLTKEDSVPSAFETYRKAAEKMVY